MAVAMAYPEGDKGGRGKKGEGLKCAETAQFSKTRLMEARLVLKNAPDLAAAVFSGAEKLDNALSLVRSGTASLTKELKSAATTHRSPWHV